MKTVIKVVLLLIVAFVVWKKVIPSLTFGKGKSLSPAAASSSPGGPVAGSCIEAANHATDVWGSGVGKFANPPYRSDSGNELAKALKLKRF